MAVALPPISQNALIDLVFSRLTRHATPLNFHCIFPLGIHQALGQLSKSPRPHLILLFGATPMLAGCATTSEQPFNSRMLTLIPEPHFLASESVNIAVHRLGESDVVAHLERTLAASFDAKAVRFAFESQSFIVVAGAVVRRQVFKFTNLTSAIDMHGPCTQRVLVWFNASGELIGSYTQDA